MQRPKRRHFVSTFDRLATITAGLVSVLLLYSGLVDTDLLVWLWSKAPVTMAVIAGVTAWWVAREVM